MGENSQKEEILKKVRQGLLNKDQPLNYNIDFDSPVYAPLGPDLLKEFAVRFEASGGDVLVAPQPYQLQLQLLDYLHEHGLKKIWCRDETLLDDLGDSGFLFTGENEPPLADASITPCLACVARTGSVMFDAQRMHGRAITVLPPVHIVIATVRQVVAELDEALKVVGSGTSSMYTFSGGPSRTADIEKTLVRGAHGPRRMAIFFLNGE